MLYLIKLNDQFVQKKFLQFHFIYHSSSNDISVIQIFLQS